MRGWAARTCPDPVASSACRLRATAEGSACLGGRRSKDDRGDREKRKDERRREFLVLDAKVSADRADEIQHESYGGGESERHDLQANEQPDGAREFSGGEQRPPRHRHAESTQALHDLGLFRQLGETGADGRQGEKDTDNNGGNEHNDLRDGWILQP
jgi:hypothetical protein